MFHFDQAGFVLDANVVIYRKSRRQDEVHLHLLLRASLLEERSQRKNFLGAYRQAYSILIDAWNEINDRCPLC